jgi:hypothetical protein
VLVGATKRSLKPVAQAMKSGFETAIPLPGRVRGRYVTVQALDPTGRVLGAATPAVLADPR